VTRRPGGPRGALSISSSEVASAGPGRRRESWLGRGLAVAAVVAISVGFVALTLWQPEVATFTPTPAAPADVGRALVGPVLYTVDATETERWRHFSFQLGSVVESPGPRDWDLGFRRFQIIANGGSGFAGEGGILDLGAVPFDDVAEVPANGYAKSVRNPDPSNPAIARWYTYGFFSHLLTPKPRVWAVRTADGRYAKLALVGYYCPGRQPGCVTFRYVYQGDGSTVVPSRTVR
jgi:hypothetical protein